MKKILLAMLTTMFFYGCSSSNDEKDEFYQRQITAAELESGTGIYEQIRANSTYSLTFKDGELSCKEFQYGIFKSNLSYSYYINGDSIYMEKTGFLADGIIYSSYISFVHWGFDKKPESLTGGEQLLIRLNNNPPYKLKSGYYDKK